MLKCLHRHGVNKEGYRRGFMSLSQPLREMYVCSLQSLLWNKAVSYRLNKYGNKELIIGDIVVKKVQRILNIFQRRKYN
eukprot:UN13641